MELMEKALRVADRTRSLAKTAAARLASEPAALDIARRRAVRPIDYMRYAEFDAILRDLDMKPDLRLLDISSPQWFAIYLADQYPQAEIIYTNIIERELAPFRRIGEALGLGNLTYRMADVRSLDYPDATFDRVVSISVIEHVYPEVGGDVTAFREIRRVLKPDGRFVVTMPFKAKRNIVYVDGEVYERGRKARNFFAREYDKPMFDTLVKDSAMDLLGAWYICESGGRFAIDFYEWGPGKDDLWAKLFAKCRKVVERGLGKSFEEALAKQNLYVSRDIEHRVVNIAAALTRG